MSLESPIGFFTNVASRLLRSELGVDLNRIQIYPTNQYTPSVHRLLQVTANVYDAATNRPISDYPFVPSVFRPLFTNDGGAIYICGYAEETGTNLLNATMRDVTDPTSRAALQAMDMVYGVPVIVGTKKGWPNFNEFGMQSDITVSRTLSFHRAAPGLPVSTTNQVYTLGVSNAFGLEAWNSYKSTFLRPLQLFVTVDVAMAITNGVGVAIGPDGFGLSNIFSTSLVTNIPAVSWSGFASAFSNVSFVVPVFTNYWFLTNSSYVFSQNAFTNGFDPVNYFPNLQLSVNIGARVRFVLIDSNLARIVDYVNLSSSDPPLSLADLLKQTSGGSDAICDGSFNQQIGSLFCTNRLMGSPSPTMPTFGILNQFGISMGSIFVPDAFWRTYNADSNDRLTSENAFRANILLSTGPLDFTSVFNPKRTIHYNVSWQANDPLVHCTVWDLPDLFSGSRGITFDQDNISSPLSGVGGQRPLNLHYRPWGGSPLKSGDTSPPTSKRFEIKDSQVTGSDAWNFPTNGYPSLDWIGKVHRGTPWQTLFLKATNVDLPTWTNWTGIADATEARLTMPTNDWRVVSMIISMLNTNDPHHLFSLNQPSGDAWRGVLDGITVLTNTGLSQFDTLVMSSNSPQAATIGGALDAARANQPNHYFRDVGDILATPELTTASPWLNPAQSGITDEAYEKIPSQLLPLLRPDSVGSISVAGDTLHIQFSGVDGYAYAAQISSNLSDWTTVSTNYPHGGAFSFTDGVAQNSSARFYRSILLP